MLLEFKTARSKISGARKYLAIDTEAHVYSTFDRHIVTPGIEIKTADYNEMVEKCKNLEFEKKETAIF